MDPINKALEEVENQIPPQILRYAFVGQDDAYNRIPVNLQTLIRDKVIGHRVLPDCDINGGVRDSINISKLGFRSTPTGDRIYQIPKSITQGRTLINPLSVGNSTYITNQNDSSYSTGQSLGALGNRVLDGHNPPPSFHTTDVRCIGENIILVDDIWDTIGPDIWLLGVFSHDLMLSNLNPRCWSVFEEMVVLATKAWIYNNCHIRMGEAVIEMGMEIGRFRETVDEYADANELYREMVTQRWPKIALLGDKTGRKRHIRRQTPTY